MKVHYSIEDFPLDINTVITIGTFDGVHKGHQTIVDRVNQIAQNVGLESVVLTFHPHPRHVIYPDNQQLRLINTIDEKIDALSNTNLNHLIIHEFTHAFSRIKSVNFIRDILVNRLNMRYMVVGFDHHFGKNREGTFESLVELSNLYDFKIEKIAAQNIEKVSVSSTKIRNAIHSGDLKKANSYLCSNFSIAGKVLRGNGLGSKIGFPTANIKIDDQWKILPKNGVYVVDVLVKDQNFFGMLNLGFRPSLDDNSFAIEVHLFDFNSNIYHEKIKIEFLQRIRSEKKFENLDQLKSQLKIDEFKCKKILGIIT